MKKSYSKAEAYKISFHATEQVAAACEVLEADIADKFYSDALGYVCSVENSMYGVEGWGSCLVNEDGSSTMFEDYWKNNLQYAD